ncbi:MAG: creatininase family protein [bacterium]
MAEPSRPYLLLETNWKTIQTTHYEAAVLPWGATEPHNYHLPFGTDILEATAIAAEAARIAWEAGAKIIVLPTIPFGVNTGQIDLKLTINMNPSTQFIVLRDVVDSLNRQGIHKLIIFNSHGGNDFRQMIRELQPIFPAMLICVINWWQIITQKDFFEEPDDHAGEMETSVMLSLAPSLVLPLSEAGDGTTKGFTLKALKEKWAWSPREWRKVTEDTGAGNPRKATQEKGERYLKAVTLKVADFLIELSKSELDRLYA